jgi:hypothetical protein
MYLHSVYTVPMEAWLSLGEELICPACAGVVRGVHHAQDCPAVRAIRDPALRALLSRAMESKTVRKRRARAYLEEEDAS